LLGQNILHLHHLVIVAESLTLEHVHQFLYLDGNFIHSRYRTHPIKTHTRTFTKCIGDIFLQIESVQQRFILVSCQDQKLYVEIVKHKWLILFIFSKLMKHSGLNLGGIPYHLYHPFATLSASFTFKVLILLQFANIELDSVFGDITYGMSNFLSCCARMFF